MSEYEKQSKINQLTIPNLLFGSGFAICSFLSLTLINPAIASEKLLPTLTVTGNGIERIATTLTQVRLGVEIQGKTATEVQQEVAWRTSAVVDLLRSKDVEQLQTTGVRLQPNYDYSNNQRRLEHRFSIQNPVQFWDFGSSQKPRFRWLNIRKSSFWYY